MKLGKDSTIEAALYRGGGGGEEGLSTEVIGSIKLGTLTHDYQVCDSDAHEILQHDT